MSKRRRRSRRNPVGLAVNPRRRHSRRRRRNPPIASTVKRFLPLPPLPQIASLAAGSWSAGFVTPRVLALAPFLSANVLTRVLSRLAVWSGLSLAANQLMRDNRANAEMFALGALANQIPHLTNDVLSLARVRINFGETDSAEELGVYYGEEPLMLGESPELGLSPELGHFWGASQVAA